MANKIACFQFKLVIYRECLQKNRSFEVIIVADFADATSLDFNRHVVKVDHLFFFLLRFIVQPNRKSQICLVIADKVARQQYTRYVELEWSWRAECAKRDKGACRMCPTQFSAERGSKLRVKSAFLQAPPAPCDSTLLTPTPRQESLPSTSPRGVLTPARSSVEAESSAGVRTTTVSWVSGA